MKNMRLKLARVEMNLSQEELAAKVNVTRPTINLLEGGKFNPSLQLCIRICKVYITKYNKYITLWGK